MISVLLLGWAPLRTRIIIIILELEEKIAVMRYNSQSVVEKDELYDIKSTVKMSPEDSLCISNGTCNDNELLIRNSSIPHKRKHWIMFS